MHLCDVLVCTTVRFQILSGIVLLSLHGLSCGVHTLIYAGGALKPSIVRLGPGTCKQVHDDIRDAAEMVATAMEKRWR